MSLLMLTHWHRPTFLKYQLMRKKSINWVATHSSLYPRHTFMPSSNDDDDGAAIFWNINKDDTVTIDFAIAVRSEGWVGFGLSEAGGMTGSDMALFSVANPDDIVDAYVVDDRSTP